MTCGACAACLWMCCFSWTELSQGCCVGAVSELLTLLCRHFGLTSDCPCCARYQHAATAAAVVVAAVVVAAVVAGGCGRGRVQGQGPLAAQNAVPLSPAIANCVQLTAHHLPATHHHWTLTTNSVGCLAKSPQCLQMRRRLRTPPGALGRRCRRETQVVHPHAQLCHCSLRCVLGKAGRRWPAWSEWSGVASALQAPAPWES